MINKVSSEMVRNHLDKCIQCIAPFLLSANCHMVTFITGKLYEKYIPLAIRNEMKSLSHIDKATDIFWDHLNDNVNETKISGFDNFQKYLADMREHNLDKIDNIWITPDELKTLIGCKSNDLLNIKGFMSEKKNYEVEVTADTVASICASTAHDKNLYVVDAGGGKGYLSAYLALEHKIKVLGVDCNPNITINAVNRSEKLERLWSSLKIQAEEKIANPTLKKGGRRARGKQKHLTAQTDETISKRHVATANDNYKTITHFITCQTNFLDLFRQHFYMPITVDFPGICLVGLHTCGDLGPSCMRIYNSSEHIKSVCNIGCCYNLLNEKYDNFTYKRILRVKNERSCSPVRCKADVPLDELNTFGFPMSKYLDERKMVLGRNARMLSCQSIDRAVAQHEQPHKHLFYRALLEVLIAQQFPAYDNLIEVGKLKACSSFVEYVRKSTKRNVHINFDNFTDDEINQFYVDHASDEKKMNFFYLWRLSLAPVIETIILLDRLLYLLEMDELNEYKRHSYMVRFFNPVISPRCYGLVAMKF